MRLRRSRMSADRIILIRVIRGHPCPSVLLLDVAMLDLPPVIGHRGAAAHAPENTLASFAAAADLGCRMVEFDVRLTADGVPVVFHDDTLDRCTPATGPVAVRTLDELRRLAPSIPSLEDVLALCAGRGMAVNIEIKPHAGAEAETARIALEAAGRLWPSDLPAPLVSSFRPACLDMARRVAPHWPRGLLVERVPSDWRARVEAMAGVALHAHHRALSAGLAHDVRRAGFALLAYTVNDVARARELWNWQVSSVFSDAPDRLSS